MKIVINNKDVEAQPGETLIEAARREGFDIPSLCYAKEAKHKSSCMVCAVRNVATGQIIPSCTTAPVEGMQIDTGSPEVILTRTLSLELLLSDHRADCEAPCKAACPGNMDIAEMNRLYDRGKTDEALALLRDTLVIPATLCNICNAPCEKICRKGDINTPVAIREIKKALVARTDLDKITPPSASTGKHIAVTGSGPASLAAAYHLRKYGYEVTVTENVPADILELETGVLKRMGIRFSAEVPSPDNYAGIITPQTRAKQPARLVLEGRRLAGQVHASLSSPGKEAPEQETKPFNSTYSRFSDSEKDSLGKQLQTRPSGCLYCDCDGKTKCRLRQYATEYGIKTSRYTRNVPLEALRRREIGKGMYFEPAKCIKCGLCVYNSVNGFTFKDRGFVMQVVLPEENTANIDESLLRLCPTGALSVVI
jgi:predicted molibdopterin-dependent oxidoreductase YjgC